MIEYNIKHKELVALLEVRGMAWYDEVRLAGKWSNTDGVQILFICEDTFKAINQRYGYENEPLPVPHIPRGLGDTIAKITDRTGIAGLVHKALPNCGCGKRQDKLNELLPY